MGNEGLAVTEISNECKELGALSYLTSRMITTLGCKGKDPTAKASEQSPAEVALIVRGKGGVADPGDLRI